MKTDYYMLSTKRSALPNRHLTVPSTDFGVFRSVHPDLSQRAAETLTSADLTGETLSLTEKEAIELAREPGHRLCMAIPVSIVPVCDLGDFDVSPASDAIKASKRAGRTWGLHEIGAETCVYDGSGVTVAVIDTGIDWTHCAFKGIENRIGKNFTKEGAESDVTDYEGHGTHCAGTIFGQDVSGVRIGVARGVSRAIVAKVLDKHGVGSSSDVLAALQWVTHMRANVISMSIGLDFAKLLDRLTRDGKPQKLAMSIALKAYRDNLQMFQTLLAFIMQEGLENNGIVVTAAAGNESLRNQDSEYVIETSLPAAAPNVISVGALMRRGGKLEVAPFSNINPLICAPGTNIVSAGIKSGLTTKSGTSMACPHVAGLAALWWQAAVETFGKVSGSLIRAQVLGNARTNRFNGGVKAVDHGAGCATAPKASAKTRRTT